MTGAFWMLIGSLGAIAVWAALSYVQVQRGVKERLKERASLETRIEALRANETRLQDMIARKEKAEQSETKPTKTKQTKSERVEAVFIRDGSRYLIVRPSDELSRMVWKPRARRIFAGYNIDWEDDVADVVEVAKRSLKPRRAKSESGL